MKKKLVGLYIMVVLAMFFWAFSFIWFKMANKVFAPVTIVFFRLLISAGLLWLFTKFTGTRQPIKKSDWRHIFVLTLFNPFFYFFGESFGLTFVSSSIGSVIISLIPLFTPFAAHFFLKERLSLMNWLGIIVSFTGVVFILLVKNTGEFSWQGVALLLFAVLCAVIYTVMLKKLSFRYNALTLISWQNFLGALLFLPVFLILDGRKLRFDMFSLNNLWPVIALAVFASSLAFVFYAVGVKNLGAAKTNVFSNIMPVVTAIFAFILLGEALTFQKIFGIVVVIAGLFLSQINNPFLTNGFTRRYHIKIQDRTS
ncbi:MAG: DMT family transporter [Chlorobi bacterium]|nr:DMT family transporter [Chlorobiota bacterium]